MVIERDTVAVMVRGTVAVMKEAPAVMVWGTMAVTDG